MWPITLNLCQTAIFQVNPNCQQRRWCKKKVFIHAKSKLEHCNIDSQIACHYYGECAKRKKCEMEAFSNNKLLLHSNIKRNCNSTCNLCKYAILNVA